MRTLVDLVDSQVRALDRLAKRQDRSRASLIREALEDYLDRHSEDSEVEAFGSWGEGAVDGLEFQERVRREW
jgi:predicted transcriptional regulator